MLSSIQHYFKQVFNEIHAGGQKIQQLRHAYDYPEVAKEFRVIDNDWQQSVVVPWREGINLIAELSNIQKLTLQDWRRLQRYTVQIPLGCQSVAEYPNGMKIGAESYDSNFGFNTV